MARVLIQPSQSALSKAYKLGRQMAAEDPRFRPRLADVGGFPSYDQFRGIHRSRMETNPLFAWWDDKLAKIADKEAKRLGFGLDKSSMAWDAFLTRVLIPIKQAFWTGYEEKHNLAVQYEHARRKAQQEMDKSQRVKAQVFKATVLNERLEAPKVDDAGDEAFWLKTTEDQNRPRPINKPNVLQASRLLDRMNKPEVQEGDEDFWMSVTEVLEPEKPKQAAAPVDDEDSDDDIFGLTDLLDDDDIPQSPQTNSPQTADTAKSDIDDVDVFDGM